jgi:hypothetical protein
MGLNIGKIASEIGRNLVKPLEFGLRLKQEAPTEALDAGADLAADFAAGAGASLSDVFAARTGLSTALHPLARRLAPSSETPSDKAFDGHFVGAGGATFGPQTPLAEIPAVTPRGGARTGETLLYVNGIQTNVAGQAGSLQTIADRTGARVVGVHNATGSFVGDVAQSLGDKLDIGANPAVDTLADTVYGELAAGRGVHLLAHSQGAIIASRALEDVRNRLTAEDGLARGDAERLMSEIRVETFGGAARRFPDGPQYVHYVNRNDGVPQAFGLRSWLNPFAEPGRGAETHYFRAGKPLVSHGFEEFYWPERVPFEAARAGNFD